MNTNLYFAAIGAVLAAGIAAVVIAHDAHAPPSTAPTVRVQGSFKQLPIEGYKTTYTQVNDHFLHGNDPAFNTFGLMLGDAWLAGHKEQAMECAAKHNQPQASPECAWELPVANDWLGCVFYQFDNPNVFKEYHFETFEKLPVLVAWIESNRATLASTAPGQQFLTTLEKLPDLAGVCEDDVREHEPAKG